MTCLVFKLSFRHGKYIIQNGKNAMWEICWRNMKRVSCFRRYMYPSWRLRCLFWYLLVFHSVLWLLLQCHVALFIITFFFFIWRIFLYDIVFLRLIHIWLFSSVNLFSSFFLSSHVYFSLFLQLVLSAVIIWNVISMSLIATFWSLTAVRFLKSECLKIFNWVLLLLFGWWINKRGLIFSLCIRILFLGRWVNLWSWFSWVFPL